MSEGELWEDLCLCILSSNIQYETATSAFLQLREKGLIDINAPNRRISISEIRKELSRRVYLPRTKDGAFRRFRFWKRTPHYIVGAQFFFYRKNNGIHSLLQSFLHGNEMRSYLADNVPGIGLKQASHFLRNIKYCDNLAIIDSHIIRYMAENKLTTRSTHPNKSQYLDYERVLLKAFRNRGISPSIMDSVIWNQMRNEKR